MEINYNNNWTSICNSALTRIGRPMISALSDDTNDAAMCREFLPQASAICAEYSTWSFLLHSLSLPASAGTNGFNYSFSLPFEVATLTGVDTGGASYRKIGQCILTDNPSCTIEYVALPEEPTNLPKTYCAALSCYLAFLIAYPLTGNQELRSILLSEFQTWIEQAVVRDNAHLPTGGNDYWCKG